MRLLVLCLLIYLAYRVVKSFAASGKSHARPVTAENRRDVAPVDDVMVQDPVCETYIPKRDAIAETVGGETFYFCSNECRNSYLEKVRQSAGGESPNM